MRGREPPQALCLIDLPQNFEIKICRNQTVDRPETSGGRNRKQSPTEWDGTGRVQPSQQLYQELTGMDVDQEDDTENDADHEDESAQEDDVNEDTDSKGIRSTFEALLKQLKSVNYGNEWVRFARI